jgi:hypothetical protein
VNAIKEKIDSNNQRNVMRNFNAMNKQLYLILLFVLCSINFLSGQTAIPAGAYVSLEALKSGKPSLVGKFKAEIRSNGAISMVGGNDFKIYSEHDLISEDIIKNNYYAISTGDSVFINGLQFDAQQWYCLLKNDADYFYFMAAPCTNRKSHLYIEDNSMGGGISGAKGAHKRYLYTIDNKTNETDVITDYYLQSSFAKKNIDLFRQYRKETTRDSAETMLKYYKLLKALK